ncbi:hypothetical protein PENSPDRAFT_693427 [Peniophora sp. CONT]|nr:hypothetical protein PENSPDRAFT_693427 [Peniophora sp. CONT]
MAPPPTSARNAPTTARTTPNAPPGQQRPPPNHRQTRAAPRTTVQPSSSSRTPSTQQAAPASHMSNTSAAKKPVPSGVTVAVKWADGTAAVAFNTTYRPPDVQSGLERDGRLGRDGLWACHEYTRHPQPFNPSAPYMPWVKIPSPQEAKTDLLYRRASRQDVAMEAEPIEEEKKGMEGQKGVLARKVAGAQGARHGMYRLKDDLYVVLLARQKALRADCDRATRLLGRAASTKMGKLDSKSAVRSIINDLREPWREYLDSARSCELLRWGRFGTYDDFDICWTAHQRALWIMQAYFDFVGAFLPVGFAPLLASEAAVTPSASRRGVILAGKDLSTYFKFFNRLRIPIWAWIKLDEFDVPGDKFGPADPSRCDLAECDQLGQHKQKQLPVHWYPPPAVPSSVLEPVGRGIVPRPDVDTFELGDQAESRKRRLEGLEKDLKRQKVAKGKALERATGQFGNLGFSLNRYQELNVRSPAARRYFINNLKPRPSYAPRVEPSYTASEHDCIRHLELLAAPLKHVIDQTDPAFFEKATEVPREVLEKSIAEQLEQRALRTFMPPLSIFLGVKTWDKTVMYTLNAIKLLPHILARVKTSRTDSHVKPLSVDDWKNVLSVNHWKMGAWRDAQRRRYVDGELRRLREELEPGEELDEAKELKRLSAVRLSWENYDHDKFWKYGSLDFFGEVETERLQSTDGATLELGKLSCGCEATYDSLHKDPILVGAILGWFEQIRLIQWLATLSYHTLAEDGIPSAAGMDGVHMPDFTDEADIALEWVRLLQWIGLHSTSVGKDGWPQGSDDTPDIRIWLVWWAKFLSWADLADIVDEYMKTDQDNMLNQVELSHLELENLQQLNDKDLHTTLRIILDRYILTSFAAKQWPVEINVHSDIRLFKCSHCRAQAANVAFSGDTGTTAQSQNEDGEQWVYDEGLSDEEGEHEGWSESE